MDSNAARPKGLAQISYREFTRHYKKVMQRNPGEHALLFVHLTGPTSPMEEALLVLDSQVFKDVAERVLVSNGKFGSLTTMPERGFALFVRDCSERRALQLARLFRHTLQNSEIHAAGQSFYMGISTGVVTVTQPIDLGQLIDSARHACLLARQKGHNRIEIGALLAGL